MKAQAALEYLIIIAVVLGVSAVVVMFVTGAFKGSSGGAELSECRMAAASCQGEILVSGAGVPCPFCDSACADAAGKDVISGTLGCGAGCQMCKQGMTVSLSEARTFGLVGYWGFENDFTDSSGNGNTLTPSGATVASGSQKKGCCSLQLAAGQYAYRANSPSINTTITNDKFTFTAWVFQTSSVANGDVIGFNGYNPTSNNWAYCFRIPNSNPQLGFQPTSNPTTWTWRSSTSLPVPLNQWAFIAVTYDASVGQLTFYVNGNSQTLSESGTVTNPTAQFRIGVSGWGTFLGNIDEVRVYNRALGPTEIADLYNTP